MFNFLSYFKTSYIFSYLCAGLAYLSSSRGIIHSLIIFIIIDLLTGIWASYKEKKPIISHKLRRTVEKFVCYSIAIIISLIFEKEFITWSNMVSIVGAFIASIEVISIFENIYRITGLNIFKRITEIVKTKLNILSNKP